MTFTAALAAADAMSPQEQMRALIEFRRSCASFATVREAFIAAVMGDTEYALVGKAVAVPATENPRRRDNSDHALAAWRPWKTNWAAALTASFMGLSAFLTGTRMFAVARTLWLY